MELIKRNNKYYTNHLDKSIELKPTMISKLNKYMSSRFEFYTLYKHNHRIVYFTYMIDYSYNEETVFEIEYKGISYKKKFNKYINSVDELLGGFDKND